MPKDNLAKSQQLAKQVTQYFSVWVGSIVVFYLSIFLAGGDVSKTSSLVVLMLLASMLVGFIFFCLLVVTIFRVKNWKMLGVTGGVFVLFFVIMYSLPGLGIGQAPSQISQSDPLVDCEVHKSCGGGTKRMKQSECVNATCCQVGNVWVTTDKDECKLKQQEYSQANKPAPVTNVRIQQPIQIPTVAPIEPPLCCKQNCNSFSGTCTTQCSRTWFCN